MKKRKKSIHAIYKLRSTLGEYHHLHKMLKDDEERFVEYYRMTPSTFQYIFNKIRPDIEKGRTNFAETISPEQRLAVTLR